VLPPVVVCIGNELVADDAAGYEVYRRLAESGIEARLEYLAVGGIDILQLLRGEGHLIVVDAVQLGAPPGTVHRVPWERLPATREQVSAHDVGLREAIEIGKVLYPELLPERVTLVGIEGRCFNRTREHMSAEVSRALDHAAQVVRELVRVVRDAEGKQPQSQEVS